MNVVLTSSSLRLIRSEAGTVYPSPVKTALGLLKLKMIGKNPVTKDMPA